jgi:methionine-gamma-lyase
MSTPEQRIRDLQHFGEEGGVVPVIDVAATSTFLDPKDMERRFQGELEGCYLYSRHSNPSVSAFGKKMAAMEASPAALGVASGMAAIASTLEQILIDGGHVVSSRTVYGGTWALMANVFPRRGITVTFVDPRDPEAARRAIRPDTKVLYTESLSNPLLAACDLKAWGKIAADYNLKLIVDNTFAPLMLRPIELGAFASLHSCTKFISGSADLIAGVICSSSEFVNSLIDVNSGSVMLRGPVMDARIAHELYLRLDHLPIRVKAHSAFAQRFAEALESDDHKVYYPGLRSHPDSELIRSSFDLSWGFGGMLTLDCGDASRANALAQRLQEKRFGLYAVSLGFSRTLMSVSALSTSSEIPPDERKKMGLSDGLLRLSVGYTGDLETMTQRLLEACHKVLKS